MLRYVLGDEVFSDHLTALGPDLGPLFQELCGELLLLNDKWRAYTDLFAASPRRLDLLDRAASRFFAFLQPTLFDDTAAHLVRLTASAKSEAHSFLTVQRLPELIRDNTLRSSVTERIEVAVERSAFAREWLRWRNHSRASRSYSSAINGEMADRIAAHQQDVSEAAVAIARVLNRVHEHFFDFELAFAAVDASGDALELLHVLNIGVSARESHESGAVSSTGTEQERL